MPCEDLRVETGKVHFDYKSIYPSISPLGLIEQPIKNMAEFPLPLHMFRAFYLLMPRVIKDT